MTSQHAFPTTGWPPLSAGCAVSGSADLGSARTLIVMKRCHMARAKLTDSIEWPKTTDPYTNGQEA